MMDPNNLPHHVYLHKDHKYRLKLGFYAAPSNPKAFSKAIRDELHKLRFTYCSDLNGLIMGFGKISSNELIPADIRHCINVVVNVDVYIFKPPVGSIIEAVVNQTSDNHVSCLVHNLFNVSIVRPENKPCDQWSGSKIKKDDKIDVKVLSFDLTKKLPHITGEIIKKNDDCYDPKNIKNSSFTKSSSSKNIVSDFTKSFNKSTASLSTYSSNDSECSDEQNNMITESKICADESTKVSPLLINTTIKQVQKEDTAVSISTYSSNDSEYSDEQNNIITESKICADESIKISPLSINTTIKHAQKEDTAVSSSILSSSDSESSAEINNMITSSKICEDKTTKKSPVSTNTTIQHQDTADSSSELSSFNSEFSTKIKVELTNFEECDKNKSSRTSSRIRANINNTKHIESPLYSSTPILNSEHSVNSINLIRNKQLKQLKKHLAKNSTEKQKSLAAVKVPNQFAKDKFFKSLNILQNIKNNDNNDPLEVLAASVNTQDNLGSPNKISHHSNLQGDSGLSDSEHKNISVHNSFSRKSEKSTKTTKKHRKSNEIVDAILNSISLNGMKSNANITKHLVDSNNECSNDEKEEKTIYTQHKHNLDEGLLINRKHCYESAVKNSLTLNLSTKNIRKEDTPQKKNTDDNENQIKNKVSKKCSNVTLSMISDSDSNCSKDLKSFVKDLSRTTHFNKEIENDTSSSDDEIYSKLRQNISKTQINTNHYNEKPKSQSLDYNNVYFSTDESDSSSKLFCNTSKLSSKLIKSNVTNILETDVCNKSNDNNLLLNKKTFKKEKKKKEVNEKSAPPQLTSKIVNKMDIIKHILDKDSSSGSEVTTLKKKTSDEKRKKGKVSRKISSLNVSKLNENDGLLNKNISNPFLKKYTENITSSSSDDETFVLNLMKSKKSSDKKKIQFVNDEEKKNILINKVLTSIKRKNKKQILPVSQNNSKASESKKKLFENDKITKDKPIVKTKNKKDILNILKNSIGEPKPNVPNFNISQKVDSSQLNIQPSSNESTDEENDVIKKILRKRKLKKTKKAYVPEQSMQINISTKSNKQNEIKEKLHTKSKSQNVSMADEVKSNDIKKKKKRPRETKNNLVDSIINALENPSDHAPSKKKKKDHNLTIEESHDSKDKNSVGNLSEVKMKKKKKSKHKDNISLVDLILKDNKKKTNDSFFESLPKNIEAKVDNTLLKVSKKKKRKSDTVFYETPSTIADKSSKIIDKLEDNNVKLKNAGSSKKKTQKLLESQMKNFMLTQDNTHLDNLYDSLNMHLIQS
ncbi:MATH and LRR domain-containing protein PFE0570w [Metopolophium dirhodum]|uniref:MATH and LRR domain-containing protein PFE0570w n=1 Tax=Metopolophium dirhodum TaxID=44670 RepID=UPI00298FF7DC|nr:MATH and LRR domain-containing protein PFE0570w [Metopolophium dirhodum]XP_060863174.1 MATH and LRR domain-containing protein PFE0570w [Metopolophium dirhodum]XP_060863175.1 MATH and LRR domain-containing protein PFE0570w [Metopolophium dirhodum]